MLAVAGTSSGSPAWRDQVAEFASSLKKDARIHIAGYLRSRETKKQFVRLAS